MQGPDGQVIDLELGKDFQVMGLSGSGKVSAPLVFVGHGVKGKEIDFDDFKGLDVAGKIVVLIRRTPRWKGDFDGDRKTSHASLERKQALAETRRAAAVLLVNDRSEKDDDLMDFKLLNTTLPSSIPAMQVKRASLDPIIMAVLGKHLKEIEEAIDKDLKPQGAPLKGWSATLQCKTERTRITVKNVIGVLEGAGPLADQTVVVGAHYDHLGYGGFGSLAPKVKAIHHGADDNASGTTAIMELARRFGAIPNRQGRRIVFISFSAEERGLLGSVHYCKEPLFPLAKTVAMVNLNMVGRARIDVKTQKLKLLVEGLGTGKGFEQLVDKLNDGEFKLIKKQSGLGPSDHDSFCRVEIPVLFIWTGDHEDYHKPSDTSDKINVPGMKKVANLVEKAVASLAGDAKRFEFAHVKRPPLPMMPKGADKAPRLGIRPDYGEEESNGLRVVGVTDDGPAGKAGMKAGNVIVEIAGQPVRNLSTYMVIMAQQKTGQMIDIVVLREGQKVTLKATPK